MSGPASFSFNTGPGTGGPQENGGSHILIFSLPTSSQSPKCFVWLYRKKGWWVFFNLWMIYCVSQKARTSKPITSRSIMLLHVSLNLLLCFSCLVNPGCGSYSLVSAAWSGAPGASAQSLAHSGLPSREGREQLRPTQTEPLRSTMGQQSKGKSVAQNQPAPVHVNRVLLEHSHAYLLVFCFGCRVE